MLRYVVVAGALAVGGMTLTAQPAAAAPMTPINPELQTGSVVDEVRWGRRCRSWNRTCRYRWGRGWRYRRCMRRHRC